MTKGVWGNTFVNFCQTYAGFDSFLNGGLVEVMPTDLAGFGIFEAGGGREDILPDPFFMGVRVFAFKRIRQID